MCVLSVGGYTVLNCHNPDAYQQSREKEDRNRASDTQCEQRASSSDTNKHKNVSVVQINYSTGTVSNRDQRSTHLRCFRAG
eukprot:scaffold26677_cov188-Skeletonema_menzelii.AAC.1